MLRPWRWAAQLLREVTSPAEKELAVWRMEEEHSRKEWLEEKGGDPGTMDIMTSPCAFPGHLPTVCRLEAITEPTHSQGAGIPGSLRKNLRGSLHHAVGGCGEKQTLLVNILNFL